MEQIHERVAELRVHRDSVSGCPVWQVAVEPGQRVSAGERIIVLEAMKMEFIVAAPADGVVELVHCLRGGMVMAGQNLSTLRVYS